MKSLPRLMLVLAIAATSFSCAKDEKAQADRPSSTATITIVAPEAAAALDGKTLKVRLELDGGHIVKQVTTKNLTPDEGHVHVSVDGELLTQTFGLSQKLKMPKPGKHLLQAEFVAKDHGPFSPRVLNAVNFTVT
jgi:hypothetical protein